MSTVPDRFEFVFTPKHASWRSLEDGLFSKMTKQMLRNIRLETKDELVIRIYKYFDEINETPVIYLYKKLLIMQNEHRDSVTYITDCK